MERKGKISYYQDYCKQRGNILLAKIDWISEHTINKFNQTTNSIRTVLEVWRE